MTATASSLSNSSSLSALLRRPLTVQLILQLLRRFLLSRQLWDWLKVVAIGASFSGSNWLRELVWQRVKGLLLAKAVFRDDDYPYDWVKHYLATHQTSFNSRDVEVSTKSNSSFDSDDEDEDEDADKYEDEDEDDPLSQSQQHQSHQRNSLIDLDVKASLPSSVSVFPRDSARFHFLFEGVHVFAVRDRKLVGDNHWEETLTVSFLTWKPSIIGKFVAATKQAYDQDRHRKEKVAMHSQDRDSSYWTRVKTVSKRSIETVHLPTEIKQTLLDDVRHFLHPETKWWYTDRGIPYRRGYLLYGPPGTGKTSLAHVLASEFELPIYQCTLSGKGTDDHTFTRLMSAVPARAIVILEDVDAAFGDRKVTGGQDSDDGNGGQSSVSFSCLLNAIDGLGAAESRLLLMTTNHREHLDEALIRPGRTDLQFEFKLADKDQMKQLFKRWFVPVSKGKHSPLMSSPTPSEDGSDTSSDAGSSPPGEAVAGPFNRHMPSPVELEANAEAFAQVIPEYTCSIAELQGYLLTCAGKTPKQAVEGAKVWLNKKP